jgi:hypothetical protein
MPTTVADVFAAAGLKPTGVVRWGTPVPETATGVYVVALSDDTNALTGALHDAAVALDHVEHVLAVRQELRVDGARVSPAQLTSRLAAFWLPDEVVLYIGLAGQPLRTRVRQYYTTQLGAKRPHAGGWWLKTLRCLDDLWVHYAAAPEYASAERDMLTAFASRASPASRRALHDRDRVAPFANLRTGTGLIKRHGITGGTGHLKGATQAPTASRARPRIATAPPAAPSWPAQSPASREVGGEGSQRVTARDVAAGQVRLPRAAKRLFPAERAYLDVVVRGRELRARWDPRLGPDRERSGLLAFGRGNLTGVVDVGEVLMARVGDDGRVVLG